MPKRRGKRWTASGYDKALGRKVHLGTFDTRGEAADAEADHRLKARPTGRETCDEFANRWARDYPRLAEETNVHNAERVKRFADDFKGVRLAGVDRPTARRSALLHKSNVPAVRALFGDAMRDGLVDINPFAGLRLAGKRGRKDILVLTESELREMADVAYDPRMELEEAADEFRALILFAGYVGTRPGESFALERDKVTGELARIERAYSSKTRRVKETKTYRRRTVVVPPGAQEAIALVRPHASGLLFSTPRDRMWTQSSHYRHWSMMRKLADCPGMDFYELRHVAATMLLERGVTPWDVAIQLGHSDGGQLVMELYGHPSEDGARARILAAWDKQTGPIPLNRSGAHREQAR